MDGPTYLLLDLNLKQRAGPGGKLTNLRGPPREKTPKHLAAQSMHTHHTFKQVEVQVELEVCLEVLSLRKSKSELNLHT